MGRSTLRRRIGRVGVVDLDFKGSHGWRLPVELKIDAGFERSQIHRYLIPKIPCLAVARDTANVWIATDDQASQNWLGVVSWESILPVLRDLRIDEDGQAAAWDELLDIVVADGDLTRTRPPRAESGRAAAEGLESAWPRLRAAFVDAVAKTHGKRAARPIDSTLSRKHGGSADAAGIGISLPSDRGRFRIWISLREAESTSPIVTVSWYSPSSIAARRHLKDAYRRLKEGDFEERFRGEFTREHSLPSSDVRDGLDDALARHVGADLAWVVTSGALRVDLERLHRTQR